MVELQEFAADAHVAPARVLSCEADDELPYLGGSRRSAGALSPPPPGLAAYQLAVPGEHRLESYEKGAPALAREQAAQGGEDESVLRPRRGFPF